METSNMSMEEILNNFSTQGNQSDSKLDFSNDYSGKSSYEIETETGSETETGNQEENESEVNNRAADLLQDDLTENDFKAINLLIKEGKLMPMEDEQGELISLSTKADLLDLIDRNNEYFQESSFQTAQQEFYQSKSPVWQTLLQYAENARDINDIAPLFQAIQNIDTSMKLDVENEDHQVEILRMYGSMQGLDASSIDDDIEDLKERGKLKDRASHLKPTIDKYNESQINHMIAQKQQEDLQRNQLLQDHYNNVVDSIVKPSDIGGLRLSQEHKNLVASTLIIDPKIGGLPIYTIMDNLISEKKFDILAKISLLATNPEAFDNYYGSKVSTAVAGDLQRRLRTSAANQNSNGSISDNPSQSSKAKAKSQEEKQFYFSH